MTKASTSTPTAADGVQSEHSATVGVKPMSITGRVVSELYRLEGMTPEEREWRKKWLKDQILTGREPILIPKDHPDLMNPIRRMYRKPLDLLFYKVLPIKHPDIQWALRYYTGKLLMGISLLYLGFYYFKYNTHTWQSHASWRIVSNRKSAYPGDRDFPSLQQKTKANEYVDAGFSKSIFAGGQYDTTRTAAETK